MRRTALLVAVTALVIGLAGCSSETSGNPNPGDDTGGSGLPSFPEDTPTSEESTAPSDAGTGTADLQPCELLEAPDLTALDLPTDGETRDVGAARGCQWQTSGSHTVTIGIFDELGVDGVVSDDPPQPITIGSHDAMQYTGGGSCGVSIAVTDSSRVDVLGTANGDLTRGCEVANQAAELVEPKLP